MPLLGGPELRCAAAPICAPGREAHGSTSHGGADYQLVIEGVLGSGVESEEEVLG